MRKQILLMHNYYGSSAPSGENLVFRSEIDMLLKRGHSIHEMTRHSDDVRRKGRIGDIEGGLLTPWNPCEARRTRKCVEDIRPDLVHVHNTFPLISPAVFWAIGHLAPKVLTLHNYRLFCPAAIPMRNSSVCTICLDKRSVYPAVRYGCYRNSSIATTPLAFSVWLHRTLGTWLHKVDAFIALTEFQRDVMVKSGLPAELVYVKPNFFPKLPAVEPWTSRTDSIVFVGRLSVEKGVETLIRAWQIWGTEAPELRLVGSGELRPRLEQMAKGLPVTFLGQVSSDVAQAEIARARLLVLPSTWYEGFPMVLREAFAFGTPVAASNLGALPTIVRDGINGVVFPAGNASGLLQAVDSIWRKQEHLEVLGRRSRAEFEIKYTESVNYQTLMTIYENAIFVHRERRTSVRT